MTHNHPSAPADAPAILRAAGDQVDAYLRSLLARTPAPPRLLQAIEYSLFAGGKRLRPALVLETARACVSPSSTLDAPSSLAAAASIELIHTFSLVHDDLPAMDNDDLRRGQPTCHKAFGEATAILAGDAMVALAFQTLAHDAQATIVPALITELATSTGPVGMIGGQQLDMENESKRLSPEDLKQLHRLKTGALLAAACRMGAICAHATPQTLDHITRFGQHLGLAFQIVDDILDQISTPHQLGKATRKDAQKGKNTYPALLGLEESRRLANQELASALEAIEPLSLQSSRLAALARFVVTRTH